MIAESMSAKLEIIGDYNDIKEIRDVSFSLDAKNLLADNSIMNNKAQDALKSNRYKEIRFELESITGLRSTSGGISGYATGNLFIAGKTNKVQFPFSAKINGNASLVVSGNEKINMTDFDIDPPTAMLGTLKTGDEINIKFELEFDKL
jgi:polyisoprenoid-binding protein YceI